MEPLGAFGSLWEPFEGCKHGAFWPKRSAATYYQQVLWQASQMAMVTIMATSDSSFYSHRVLQSVSAVERIRVILKSNLQNSRECNLIRVTLLEQPY